MKGEVDMNKLSSEELSKVAGGKEIEDRMRDGRDTRSWLARCPAVVRECAGTHPQNMELGIIPQNDMVVTYFDESRTYHGKEYLQVIVPYEFEGGWVAKDDLYK